MSVKKIKNKKIIKKTDLLPESREFLAEKKLAEEREKIVKEAVRLLKEKEKEKPEELPIDYNEDAHKKFLMWSGVTFFMALIFVFWVYNIKATFKQTAPQNESNISWDKISEDFKKAMGEVKENISDLKNVANTATTTGENKTLSKEEIEILRGKLEIMENNLATSTEDIATSSEN